MRRTSTPAVLCGCLVLAVGCAGNTGSGDQGAAGSNGASGSGGNSSGAAGTTGSGGSAGTSGGTAGTGGNGPGTGGSAGTVSTGTGGRGGATGSAGRGGNTGTAGSGTGGSAGASGATGSGGSGGIASCTITPTSSVSTMIPTVGIVTFTTTQSNVTSAKIDFGLTTSYGMTAPVDLTQPMYRTLLLGMKAAKAYHYRVTTTSSAGSCQGQDMTITTGALLPGLMKPTLSPATATGLYGGFLITGQYQGTTTPAYILDADGDFVWWYNIGRDVTGARMDYAGTHMWINSANVPNTQGANVHRVTMDGMTDENLTSQFTGLNHQLTVLPDETVAFYAYTTSTGCDDIKERAPNGTVKTIVNSGTALGVTGGCHCNNVQYSKDDDTLVFSDLDHVMVAKVKRSDGSTVWTLNDTSSSKNITGVTWAGGEHGLHVIDLTHILIFNNNNSAGMTSNAIEVQLDATAKTATKIWTYNGSVANMIMGDVQRLPNGNTIVAYSTKGVLHEVSSNMTKLQTWTWTQAGQTFGYIEKRASLYGPPPK